MSRVFIIAEAGVNHNGCLETARRLIDVAAEAGADAVKFQTFRPERLVSGKCAKAEYQIANTGSEGETQLEMLKKLALSFDDFVALKGYCDKVGIEFLSTPFDTESADFIEPLVDKYKVPSGEVVNTPFLAHIAAKAKPVILSTGMSTLQEVREAVAVIGRNQVLVESDFAPLTVLHCCTDYPCGFEDVNLMAMLTMKDTLQLPVGYSDHTLGIEVSISAAALGADVIEKHFTLDRGMAGPDHRSSLEPAELKRMVCAIRNVEKALGDGVKQPRGGEIKMRRFIRKSLVAERDIAAGTVVTPEMVSVKRPGDGIWPGELEKVVGMKTAVDKQYDEVLYWADFESEE